jgi:hypothetical protein
MEPAFAETPESLREAPRAPQLQGVVILCTANVRAFTGETFDSLDAVLRYQLCGHDVGAPGITVCRSPL